MKSLRLTTLLFSAALLLIASFGVSAQISTSFTTEQTSSETPEPEAPDATDEMMATDDMSATEEAMPGSPFYSGNGNAEVLSMMDQLDPAAGSGFARFAHVSPDSGPIDIYLDDLATPLVTNLMLGEYTGAVRLPSGVRIFTVRAAGSAADSQALTQFDWDLGSNSTWLITAVGTQAEATFLLEPLNVLRNFSEEIARVRVANVNPYQSGLTVNVEGGDPLAEGLQWLGVADADLPAGAVNMTVTDAEGSAVSEPVSVTLDPYMQYTILLTSTGEQSQVVPLVIASPRDTTRVRFISEREDTVEILLMPIGEMLVEQLEPGAQTEYFILPSEASTFAAYAPGTGPTGQNLAGAPVQLEPGYDTTVTFRADGSAEVTEKVFTDPMAEMAAMADPMATEEAE